MKTITISLLAIVILPLFGLFAAVFLINPFMDTNDKLDSVSNFILNLSRKIGIENNLRLKLKS